MRGSFGAFAELIEAAKTGEQTAIDQIVTQFSDEMNSHVRRFQAVRNGELSERDLCQMTWIRVLRYLPDFEGDGNAEVCMVKFKSWLSVTANHVLINELRRINTAKRGRSKQAAGGETEMFRSPVRTASSIVVANEQIEKIRRKLEALKDPVQIDVLRLRFYEGKKIAEIAKQLGLTQDQVRYAISKTIKRFRKSFEE